MDEFDEVEERSQFPEFLRDPWGVIRRRWPWMVAVFVVTSIAGGAFVSRIPEVYQASGRLLLTRQRIPDDFVRPTSLEQVPDIVDAIVGEILSGDSLVSVAETTDFRERMGVDGSMTEVIDQMRDLITVESDLDLEEESRRRSTRWDEIFILAIRFEARDPAVAADVANELVSRFMSAHLERQTGQARLATEFLRQDAKRAEAELAQQRSRITAFTKAHRGELPTELDTKLARLDRLQQQSQSLALQISNAEGRLLVQQKELQSEQPVEEALDELRAQLVEQQGIYTDEHPNVIALRRQVEALEAESARQRAGDGTALVSSDPAVAAVQHEVEALRAQARDVEQMIGELDAAITAIPAWREELLALEQDEELLRDRFNEATKKVQDAELAESLQQAQQGFQVSRLDAAATPAKPMRTRWKFAVLAAGAVLGVSGLVGLLLEYADPVIVTSRQLETQTGMLPLGVIPRIR
jgi:succinoglycan biosynthesis transport protein ExoP